MGKIKVIEGGPLTTIQDLGRYGYQEKGVPNSGAMDPISFSLGNIALGNAANAPGLECTLPGLKLEFNDTEYICITGGDLLPILDGKSCPMWKTVKVKKGSVLTLSGIKKGCRAYVCFAGGLVCPSIMSSASTLLRAGLGGYNGRELRAGDMLAVISIPGKPNVEVPDELRTKIFYPQEVRVIRGSGEYFSHGANQVFLNSEYRIGMQCDRMGCRLEGPIVENSGNLSIFSQGVPLGAVQVDGEGIPTILLKDRQTTGGYPVIATVISVDICLFAHFKPGDKIFFRSISLNEATDLYRGKVSGIERFKKEQKRR